MNNMLELVDLVDDAGTIQKKRILRSKIDLYPTLHLQIVIAVIFDTQGRMLVQRRAQTKKVNPGDIDHVCGGVMSGETPVEAAARESFEETRVKPINLKIVGQGINKYNRYRYLLVGEAKGAATQVDPAEVEWTRFMHPDELKMKHNSGELTFVDEFFEDTELAISEFN